MIMLVILIGLYGLVVDVKMITNVSDSDKEAITDLFSHSEKFDDLQASNTSEQWITPTVRNIPQHQSKQGLRITITNEDILNPYALFSLFVPQNLLQKTTGNKSLC